MTEPAREVREITSLGDWLTWREHDITASRVAALFDAHPYLTRDQLADIMRGSTSLGTGTIPPNASMRAGNILEGGFPAAVKLDGKDWDLVKATSYHRLPEHRLGCTPDFWIGDDGLLQAKTTSTQQWEAWHGHPPLAYTLQTLTELLVTGRAWGVLAIMIRAGGYPIHYFDVPRHEAAEARILDAVRQWWAAWDAGGVLEAMPSDTIAAMAADLDDGSYRDLSGNTELPPLLTERAELSVQRRQAEKRLEAIDYVIKNTLGPASSGWLPGWQLSFKAYTRREMVIPEKQIRVLRVKATEEGDAEESAA
jgi:predicted phage-related endonuclease